MTLTMNEVIALEALRKYVPYKSEEHDLRVLDEANAEWFIGQARKNMEMAQNFYAMYRLVTAPDFAEKKRALQLAEIEKQHQKMAARSQEVRGNLVSGILSGLMPKARKAGKVELEITGTEMILEVWNKDHRIFNIDYDCASGQMCAYLTGHHLEAEDWTVLGGNRPPRDQSPALKAVLEYLEGLEDGALV